MGWEDETGGSVGGEQEVGRFIGGRDRDGRRWVSGNEGRVSGLVGGRMKLKVRNG